MEVIFVLFGVVVTGAVSYLGYSLKKEIKDTKYDIDFHLNKLGKLLDTPNNISHLEEVTEHTVQVINKLNIEIKKLKKEIKLIPKEVINNLPKEVNIFNNTQMEVSPTVKELETLPKNKAGNDKEVYIFYHLFMVGKWREVWEQHLESLYKSGLYKKASQIKIGIIYKDFKDYEEFRINNRMHEKITILYARNNDDVPYTVWNNPTTQITTQLGEGETILKMMQYLKELPSTNYAILFFHSKGVTNPPNKERMEIDYFYKRGLDKECSPAEAQQFILNDLTEETIMKWRNIMTLLDSKSFYHYIWNFFWMNSSMVKNFDFEEYNAFGKYPKTYKWEDRHHTAIFPINAYGVQVKKDYKDPRLMIGYSE